MWSISRVLFQLYLVVNGLICGMTPTNLLDVASYACVARHTEEVRTDLSDMKLALLCGPTANLSADWNIPESHTPPCSRAGAAAESGRDRDRLSRRIYHGDYFVMSAPVGSHPVVRQHSQPAGPPAVDENGRIKQRCLGNFTRSLSLYNYRSQSTIYTHMHVDLHSPHYTNQQL